ncbi:hypothetical protein AWW67_17920 [Roseivirga seohaensis]|uniref:Uncharacterized protein n=1 Tax=Roseivirga seohaensis TaxID=1914963 RepID=A0A150Y2I1_9BACT|nr:hypothetical protein AWW67_17920 [Roseivirga seohaensis]
MLVSTMLLAKGNAKLDPFLYYSNISQKKIKSFCSRLKTTLKQPILALMVIIYFIDNDFQVRHYCLFLIKILLYICRV